MSIKYSWNKNHIPYCYSELARTLFPVQSTNNTKTKITDHKVIGDVCIWERISLMMLAESVCQCSVKFWMQQGWCV